VTAFAHQLALLAEELEAGSAVRGIRRMRGGLDALTHRFDLVTPDGERRPLVIRRLTGRWVQPGSADREAAILTAVAATGVAAPRPVWHDDAGRLFGYPTLVITRLPGRPVIRPDAPQWWFDELAAVLAGADAADAPMLAAISNDEQRIPAWLADEQGGRLRDARSRQLFRTLRALAPDVLGDRSPRRLVHRDFHAGNVLFAHRRATGAVDWGAAAAGWPDRDVGYCRLDLALMMGANAPDRFLAAYERHAQRTVEHLAFWDLFGAAAALPDPAEWLPSWIEFGRTDLTAPLLRRRLSRWIDGCLRRL